VERRATGDEHDQQRTQINRSATNVELRSRRASTGFSTAMTIARTRTSNPSTRLSAESPTAHRQATRWPFRIPLTSRAPSTTTIATSISEFPASPVSPSGPSLGRK
jgi:hypothetical protein